MKMKHKKLTAAILMCLLSGTSQVSAGHTEYLDYNGRNVMRIDFLDEDQSVRYTVNNSAITSQYTFSPYLTEGVKKGAEYWKNILMPRAKNTTPWQIVIFGHTHEANATGKSYVVDEGKLLLTNRIQDQLQNGAVYNMLDTSVAEPDLSGTISFSSVLFGQYYGAAREGTEGGWYIDDTSTLPVSHQACDMVSVVRHELGHALGVSANRNGFAFTKVPFGNTWNAHLYDQNLNPAREGMKIMTSAEYEQSHSGEPAENFFIVDTNYVLSADRKKFTYMDAEALAKHRAENPRYALAFFRGEHVSEVLDGKLFYGVDGLPVNTLEAARGSDGTYTYKTDLSHFSSSGVMTHKQYRNNTVFNEAELAAMQDMGYDFDRKALYGYSVYADGRTLTNTHGYWARNADGTDFLQGTYSEVPLGTGLHIYGCGNTVTQAADIMTAGTGAVGIRVDGLENTVNIAKGTELHADGLNGRGVLVAYGRNHVLNQQGTVTARGTDGDGVRFDFSVNRAGITSGYRGSYIRYNGKVDTAHDGAIISTQNQLIELNPFHANYQTDELNGAMVDSYNLSGQLEGGGGGHAIYIGKPSLVKEINVLEGASISGDIVSDWKHFSWEEDGVSAKYEGQSSAANSSFEEEADTLESNAAQDYTFKPMLIQYNGTAYVYTNYIPDLVTNLNFKMSGELAYSGNISGSDNIKLKVESGTLNYSGTADVINAEVSRDASVIGGSYIVNDMTDGHYEINGAKVTTATGFSDDTTGQFINHGTIGAATPVNSDTSMNITGRLVSDGSLQVTANGTCKGSIHMQDSADGSIRGRVEADGSTLVIDPAGKYLPGEDYLQSFVTENGRAVKINYKNASVDYKTGMLTAVYNKEKGSLTFEPEDNAGNLSTENKKTMQDMNMMFEGLPKENKMEMTELYNLPSEAVRTALDDIGNVDVIRGSVTAVQQSRVMGSAIGARLNQTKNGREGSLRAVSRMGDSEVIPMGAADASGNGGWMKFSRNWGRLADGAAKLHGSAMTFGYDRKVSEDWRVGALVSYNRTSYGSSRASLKTDDWRFGVYGGYHNGPHDAYIYADYGWQRHDQKRSVMSRRADSNYSGRLLELGGEYKYDLHAEDGKIWHVSPYAGLQLSRYTQGGYSEHGAGIYSMNPRSMSNTYIAGMAGLELRRELSSGSFMLRAGLKHAFRGTDPRLDFNYSGMPSHSSDISDSRDATMAAFSLSYSHDLGSDWSLQADAQLDRGPHDRNLTGSLMLSKLW